MRRTLGLIALLLLPTVPAGAVGADLVPAGDSRFEHPAPGGSDGSLLQGLRDLRDGTLPGGTILLGEDPPAPLASGTSVTLAVTDVDGDGDDELVRIRGTASAPRLEVGDGVTGSAVWSKAMSTYQFLARVLPDGAGASDLLVFTPGAMQRIDGATGGVAWTAATPSGDAVGFWGLSADGGDLVLGAWTVPAPQVGRLRLEWRAWATGTARGSASIDGEGDYPSAAITNDLDGDGVSDAYLLGPTYLFGGASGGLLRAVGQRGAATLSERVVEVPVTDYSWLIDGSDVTGDGAGDAVVFSEWLGAPGVGEENLVTVVDARGGGTSGLAPATQVSFRGFPTSFVRTGDVNGDGGEDLVFSGAAYAPGQGQGLVILEAIGRSGTLWEATIGYATPSSDFGYGWWPSAGDLDGDGIEDALVLLGSSSGPDMAAGVSQRGGATLWSRESLGGDWVQPAYADGDGDGGTDVLDGVWANHPSSSTTAFGFTMASGRDLEPLWSHERVLDSGANGWSVDANGGALGAGGDDLIVEYVMQGGGRHFAETLRGADGAVRWTSP